MYNDGLHTFCQHPSQYFKYYKTSSLCFWVLDCAQEQGINLIKGYSVYETNCIANETNELTRSVILNNWQNVLDFCDGSYIWYINHTFPNGWWRWTTYKTFSEIFLPSSCSSSSCCWWHVWAECLHLEE